MAKINDILERGMLAIPVPEMPGCYSLAQPVSLNHFADPASEKSTAIMAGITGKYAGKVYILEMEEWHDAGDFDVSSD